MALFLIVQLNNVSNFDLPTNLKDFLKETKTITSNKDQRFKNIFKVIKNHEEISLLQNILTYLCENKYHSKIDDIKNLKNNSKK